EGHVTILSRLKAANSIVWDTRSNNLRTPLHTAAALNGRSEAVVWMLSKCQFLPDSPDSCGVTPFMDALRGGHMDVAKSLLRTHKVKVEREDRAGRQALHHAAQAGQRSSIDFLVLELGVSSCVASSRDGETALHAAAKDGQAETLHKLLDLGADITAVDTFGRTALDVARACRKDTCVLTLQLRETESKT
ncbi:ankyrin repeat domain-containing protein 16, partial [Plakobranchus ocellatus]